ncbi:hypothetical protein BD311DRAFT_331653 [Dichomitus squalens]|uniref:Uncharacterized protein n=1 Tax=Dichomitus squalens TaxID=114155 RepID=A0A4Q9MKY2_9APHY|nr:hypothetical protein BD311DRAFT_331653 [Dichomitus squalens]
MYKCLMLANLLDHLYRRPEWCEATPHWPRDVGWLISGVLYFFTAPVATCVRSLSTEHEVHAICIASIAEVSEILVSKSGLV